MPAGLHYVSVTLTVSVQQGLLAVSSWPQAQGWILDVCLPGFQRLVEAVILFSPQLHHLAWPALEFTLMNWYSPHLHQKRPRNRVPQTS